MAITQILINRGLKLLAYQEKKRITGSKRLYLEAPNEQKLLNTNEKKMLNTSEKKLVTTHDKKLIKMC